MIRQVKPFNQGFTLIELAMVLIILGFMMAMLLGPLTTQREVMARAETIILLEEAREALFGYTIVNKHLPCPDTDNDGQENRQGTADANPGTCTNDHGAYPWATLGVKGVDAWGRYFTYGVDDTFSNDGTATGSLFNIDDAEGVSGSGIQVKTAAVGGSDLTSSTSPPVAVLFSHGANGHGARTNTGVQLALPTGVDEAENTDGNVTYISHTPTPEDSANPFDDMLIWISPKVLINRMITAGRLP